MKRSLSVEGGIYHIFNRGVEKRIIFNHGGDYARFLNDLYEFNDENSALNIYYRFPPISYDVKPRKDDRKPIVSILAFCLMPNHFHLLIQETKRGNIAKFMQKLGTGYTMYFNKKYDRVGSLFQGSYKIVPITHERHFLYIPHYIHCNPLELKFKKWKEKEIYNYKDAINFLENYQWSSLPIYLGAKENSYIIQKEFLLTYFGGAEKHKKELLHWLKEINIESVKELTFE